VIFGKDHTGRNAVRAFTKGRGLRLFLIVLLLAAVIVEGYYIHLLQNRIEERNDELQNISVRLQFLRVKERSEVRAFIS
jgi:hypothetical protein